MLSNIGVASSSSSIIDWRLWRYFPTCNSSSVNFTHNDVWDVTDILLNTRDVKRLLSFRYCEYKKPRPVCTLLHSTLLLYKLLTRQVLSRRAGYILNRLEGALHTHVVVIGTVVDPIVWSQSHFKKRLHELAKEPSARQR